MDPLAALLDELARRGVRCELDDRGIWPRLRIYCPGETAGADFDNNVVAAPISGQWCYWWPSATYIGSVARLTQAAEAVVDELGMDDGEGGGTNVASLAVSRMLGQARLEISSQPVPAGPTVGHWPAAPMWGTAAPGCCGPLAALSRGGRPLYAAHRAQDPAGAARRLAPPRHRPTK